MYQVNYGRRCEWEVDRASKTNLCTIKQTIQHHSPLHILKQKILVLQFASSSPEILLESDGKNVDDCSNQRNDWKGESLEHERKLTQELRNQKGKS